MKLELNDTGFGNGSRERTGEKRASKELVRKASTRSRKRSVDKRQNVGMSSKDNPEVTTPQNVSVDRSVGSVDNLLSIEQTLSSMTLGDVKSGTTRTCSDCRGEGLNGAQAGRI